MKDEGGEVADIDAALTGTKMPVELSENGTASLKINEGLGTLGGDSETESAVGFAVLLRSMSDAMGGAEGSRGFATSSDVLSDMSGGGDGEDEVVPASLGPVQVQFSSSEGVQDPLRGTRHCDHH